MDTMGRMEGYCTWNDDRQPLLYVDGTLPVEYVGDFVSLREVPQVSGRITLVVYSPSHLDIDDAATGRRIVQIPFPRLIADSWRRAVIANGGVLFVDSCAPNSGMMLWPTDDSRMALLRINQYARNDGVGAAFDVR